MPLNYPLGIADIEEFLNIQEKEKYLREFLKIPRVIFVGEDEEKIDGHYAYSSGKTLDGKKIKYGEDLSPFERERPLFEIENASMHNRVLDYVSAQRILFGKGANERFRNYIDLSTKLNINIQTKIYKNVGHCDIYNMNEALTNDLNTIYSSLVKENTIPILGDNERAARISPVYQLLRRYRVSKNIDELHNKNKIWHEFVKRNKALDRITEREKTIGEIEKELDAYLSSKYNLESTEINMDRIYDNLSMVELSNILGKVFNIDKIEDTTTISMQAVVSNAIMQGTATEHIINSDKIEKKELQKEKVEGVTKDD